MTIPTLIIWGANSAIAQAIALLFHQQQWRVLGVSSHAPFHSPHYHEIWNADLSNHQDVAACSLQIAQTYGSEHDATLFAAGRMLGQPLRDTTPTQWHQIIDDTLTSAHLTTSASLSLLKPDATMMFLSAYSENLRLPSIGAYAASKAALEAYIAVLAKEERHKHIMAFRMKAVDTPLWGDAPFKLPRGAAAPDAVAQQIMQHFHARSRGTIDC
jgi:3-oxoacyl-[acyl-carrier protein] reductase